MKPDTDYEEWDLDEEPEEEWDAEEEEGAVKPAVRILVFLGLVVLAAIFSVLLWNITHDDKDENEINNPTLSEESQEPDSGVESVGDSETEPEGSWEPGSETTPEGSTEPDSGTSPEPGSEGASDSEEPALNEPDNSESEQDVKDGTMAFTECEDTVTPKEVINLRSEPSTLQDDNIVTQAVNGDVLARTGINSDTGWSRLEYNGQTLYAVSRLLTTDLTYQIPAAPSDPNSVSTKDGRTITFTDCDDTISPKMYVNLRLEPSTSEGNDTVHCRLEYGEVVHRTGISEESGWSRVEYDGCVLYVVTSYMYVVEEQVEE